MSDERHDESGTTEAQATTEEPREGGDPEVDDQEVDDQEVEDQEVEDPKVDDQEVEDQEVDDPEVEDQEGGEWYALQVYSGHENKVKTLLEKRVAEIENEGVKVYQVLVPTQEVMEIKGGKKTKVTKNLYPGYILVEADMNDETKYFINSINGIIKFLGADATPQPLREREVNKILGRIEEVKEPVEVEEIPFDIGDSVDVTEGPFSDFSGTVEEVYPEKGKVKVTVSLFGRPTAVELDYLQLKKTS